MPERISLLFFGLLLTFYASMPASAQKTPLTPGKEDIQQAQEDAEVQPAPPPKSVINIEVKNDLLSVELADVDFGTAIRAVADKAGFKIEGSGDVFGRKLNAKFSDMEVERGVLRLLTLVRESNYMLYYDTKGMISKLEIFGITASRTPGNNSTQSLRSTPSFRQPVISPNVSEPRRPATIRLPQTRRIPPLVRRRPVVTRPVTIPSAQPALQTPDAAKPQSEEENGEGEETVDEIPYVAPQPGSSPSQVR